MLFRPSRSRLTYRAGSFARRTWSFFVTADLWFCIGQRYDCDRRFQWITCLLPKTAFALGYHISWINIWKSAGHICTRTALGIPLSWLSCINAMILLQKIIQENGQISISSKYSYKLPGIWPNSHFLCLLKKLRKQKILWVLSLWPTKVEKL